VRTNALIRITVKKLKSRELNISIIVLVNLRHVPVYCFGFGHLDVLVCEERNLGEKQKKNRDRMGRALGSYSTVYITQHTLGRTLGYWAGWLSWALTRSPLP
jgi:hypothetical protein